MRWLAIAICLCAAVPAQAQVNVYYHAGGWDAFDGTGDKQQPICGVGSRNPQDGRTFSLRFVIGSQDVTFIASKQTWNIPSGTQMPVVVQIGLERPWQWQAAGSGQRVQWSLDSVSMQQFDAQFRRADSMTVTFPSGNEQPWIIGLNGSTSVSNAMGRCITRLAQRDRAMLQPQGSPPTDQTQPFDPAAAPANVAPPSDQQIPPSTAGSQPQTPQR